MNRTFSERKPKNIDAKNKENETIIRSLYMYGRVPEQWELLNEIERLNNKIHDISETLNETYNDRTELRNENKRLNNIINELEKYIKESCWKDDWGVESIYVKNLLNKLQELKEKNKFNIINKPTFTTSSTSGNRRNWNKKQTRSSDKE